MKKLWIEQFGAVEYSENHTVNGNQWVDESINAEAWNEYGSSVMLFLFYRIKIQQLLIAICGSDFAGWNNLTLDQKKLMGKYIIAPKALRYEVQTVDEDKEYWKKIVFTTKLDRSFVIEKMRECVSDYIRDETMSKSNSILFLKDCLEFMLWYIESDAPDLKQWITNEVGSPYEFNGFEQTSYYNISIKDCLMLIYNGDF